MENKRWGGAESGGATVGRAVPVALPLGHEVRKLAHEGS